ncbi:MAG TPA: outer membrane protein assembly factor BamE [Thiotrichaceae bacterium]|nr:outer membrane protein assembly factor BamE [Thiotrichaceae bacterium]
MMPKYLMMYCLSVSLFLSSCSLYKIDIQQGNWVTQEMLDKLELKMPKRKVHFIMGTPLIADVFQQQRWDYLYSFQAGGKSRQERRISLFFDDNQHLVRVAGDVKIGKPRLPKPTPFPDDLDQEPIL